MLAFLFLGDELERVKLERVKLARGKFRVWRRLGRAERNQTHHRAISFQPSAISRAVEVFGAASSYAIRL